MHIDMEIKLFVVFFHPNYVIYVKIKNTLNKFSWFILNEIVSKISTHKILCTIKITLSIISPSVFIHKPLFFTHHINKKHILFTHLLFQFLFIVCVFKINKTIAWNWWNRDEVFNSFFCFMLCLCECVGDAYTL